MCSKKVNKFLIFEYYFCIFHLAKTDSNHLRKEGTMKIAISVKGTDLNSEVDPRFGRAQNFLLVDSDSGEFTVTDNRQNLDASGGAGIQSAKTVARLGAQVLLTGHCGPNAFRALKEAGVKVVTDVDGTVHDAVEKFQKGEYTFTESADVEGHW
jgi:predicted Fe-Mo cluster-binding NifX family protein